MAIELSTAGVSVQYVVETTAGTRPTTGYTTLTGMKSIPSLNPAPDTIETTDLSQLKFKTYIDGLMDVGGALEFTANLTTDFMTLWEGLITAYNTAKESNKATWFAIVVPGLSKAFYFRGNPSEMGMPAVEVNNVLETSVYITPTLVEGWATKPTV